MKTKTKSKSILEYFQSCYLTPDPNGDLKMALKDFAKIESEQKCEELLVELASALTKFEEL